MKTKESLGDKSFLTAGATAWEPAGEGIERKILGYDDHLMMVCVRFDCGTVGSMHSHAHRQVSFVESGLFEITIDGNKELLRQGDSFFVAPNLLHGATAIEAGVLIDVFAPAREDFL